MAAAFLKLPLIQFMGAVLELLLYGVYLVLFGGTVWVLRARRQGSEGRSMGPVIDLCSWFIFITLTVHCASNIYFTHHTFLVLGPNPLGQLLYIADQGSAAAQLRGASYGLLALGMEVMLIYRLWIVWGRSWAVAALPAALVVADFIGFVICLHGLDHHTSSALAKVSIDVLEPVLFFGEALTNLLCAGLLAIPIIRHSMGGLPADHGSRIEPVLWIIVDSAVVYTTLSIVVAVGLLLKHPMVFALLSVIPPVAGITSCLLLVRVGLGMAASSGSSAPPDRLSGTGAGSIPLKVSVVRHRDGAPYAGEMDDAESAHKTGADGPEFEGGLRFAR